MGIEYSYGIILSLVITGILWLYLFTLHIQSQYSFGGLMMSIGFFAQAYRCYIFYIIQGRSTTPDIMVSVFISVAVFLAGTIILVLHRIVR